MCAFRVLNPRQWSLAKQSTFKRLKSDVQKVPKQARAKSYCVLNPQNYNLNQFWEIVDDFRYIPKSFCSMKEDLRG